MMLMADNLDFSILHSEDESIRTQFDDSTESDFLSVVYKS